MKHHRRLGFWLAIAFTAVVIAGMFAEGYYLQHLTEVLTNG
jgi:hypothetical protein